ncbi:MAG: hypothetical protein JWL85_224, partial [Candidatus Saccharibacteria bacterium]|nr:hypothetical protein [Candidatus Saccharibacteria bacterium]
PARAAVDSCSVNISPGSAQAGNQTNFMVSISNTSSSDITWIHIARPSDAYKITGISGQAAWLDATSNSETTLNGSTLSSGQTLDLQISTMTAITARSAEAWSVSAAEDSSGSGSISCGGSKSTSITGYPPNEYDNGVMDVVVSNITTNSATVAWNTALPSSTIVNYGTSSSYGQSTAHDTNTTSEHSVTLSGLSSSTGYHFQVAGVDENGDPVHSADNTFLTLQSTSSSNNGGSTGSKPGPITTVPIAENKESVAPTITLQTALKRVYVTAPAITGSAGDNVAVARVDYSTDDGKNWLPVDKVTGLGTAKAAFNFTPAITEDGNYKLIIRVFDTSLNTTLTPVVEIVIDRLPPQVGSTFTASGAQILQPQEEGSMQTLTGIDQKISMSGIGGVTSVTLIAKQKEDPRVQKRFFLSNTADNDLWSGIVTFDQPGIYDLIAESKDGAGNETNRSLQTIQVLLASHVLSANTNEQITNATITVYYKDPDTREWVVWDGAAYSQINPQTTNKKGELALMLPSGIYYAKVTAPRKKTIVTDIVHVDKVLPVTTIFKLDQKRELNLKFMHISLFDFSVRNARLNQSSVKHAIKHELIGKPFPNFTLPTTKDQSATVLNLGKRPGVVTVMESWSPTTTEQLQILKELQTNQELIVMPVFTHESLSKVKSMLAIAGTDISSVADPEGKLIVPLKVAVQPTHYIVDQKGNVKKVLVGVLSKQRLTDEMVGH